MIINNSNSSPNPFSDGDKKLSEFENKPYIYKYEDQDIKFLHSASFGAAINTPQAIEEEFADALSLNETPNQKTELMKLEADYVNAIKKVKRDYNLNNSLELVDSINKIFESLDFDLKDKAEFLNQSVKFLSEQAFLPKNSSSKEKIQYLNLEQRVLGALIGNNFDNFELRSKSALSKIKNFYLNNENSTLLDTFTLHQNLFMLNLSMSDQYYNDKIYDKQNQEYINEKLEFSKNILSKKLKLKNKEDLDYVINKTLKILKEIRSINSYIFPNPNPKLEKLKENISLKLNETYKDFLLENIFKNSDVDFMSKQKIYQNLKENRITHRSKANIDPFTNDEFLDKVQSAILESSSLLNDFESLSNTRFQALNDIEIDDEVPLRNLDFETALYRMKNDASFENVELLVNSFLIASEEDKNSLEKELMSTLNTFPVDSAIGSDYFQNEEKYILNPLKYSGREHLYEHRLDTLVNKFKTQNHALLALTDHVTNSMTEENKQSSVNKRDLTILKSLNRLKNIFKENPYAPLGVIPAQQKILNTIDKLLSAKQIISDSYKYDIEEFLENYLKYSEIKFFNNTSLNLKTKYNLLEDLVNKLKDTQIISTEKIQEFFNHNLEKICDSFSDLEASQVDQNNEDLILFLNLYNHLQSSEKVLENDSARYLKKAIQNRLNKFIEKFALEVQVMDIPEKDSLSNLKESVSPVYNLIKTSFPKESLELEKIFKNIYQARAEDFDVALQRAQRQTNFENINLLIDSFIKQNDKESLEPYLEKVLSKFLKSSFANVSNYPFVKEQKFILNPLKEICSENDLYQRRLNQLIDRYQGVDHQLLKIAEILSNSMMENIDQKYSLGNKSAEAKSTQIIQDIRLLDKIFQKKDIYKSSGNVIKKHHIYNVLRQLAKTKDLLNPEQELELEEFIHKYLKHSKENFFQNININLHTKYQFLKEISRILDESKLIPDIKIKEFYDKSLLEVCDSFAAKKSAYVHNSMEMETIHKIGEENELLIQHLMKAFLLNSKNHQIQDRENWKDLCKNILEDNKIKALASEDLRNLSDFYKRIKLDLN